VHGWETDGADANFTLFTWTVGPDAGNMTVSAPASGVLGGPGTINLSWSGLAAATKYLGVLTYQSPEAERTVVRVDTP
jgi:hypothetical protein